MSEGEESKPKSTPSVPPDRAAALARKLTGGRSVPPALGKLPTEPPKSAPITPRSGPSEAPAPSKRDAVLAARRASITPGVQSLGPSDPPVSEPPPAQKRTRKGFLVLGGLLLVVSLGVAGVYAKQAMHERSDEGRVHLQLLAWEFGPRDPAAREAAFAELDRMGPSAIAIVIDKLADGSFAERGSSRSTHTIQRIAHLYLLHLAVVSKAPPPKEAEAVERAIFEGGAPSAQQWTEARDAWRAWVSDQQARGALPK